MVFQAVETTVLIPFITVEMTDLIVFHTIEIWVLIALTTVVTVVFIAFHTVEKMVLIPFSTELKKDFIPFHTVEAVVFNPFHRFTTVVLMAVHTVVNVVFIVVRTVVKNPEIAFHTVVATVFIPLIVLVKKVLMLFQVLEKNVFTLVHTVSQSVPNQERNTFATPLSVSSTVEKIDLMPSQIEENTPFTASHAPDQFPWKRLLNTSKRPSSTSSTVPNIVEITWNAPSNTGASTSQNLFHTALMTSVMSLKEKPRAFSRCTMPSEKALNFAFSPSQMAVTLLRNSSLFFHRFTKAATRTAMTATTASTVPDTPPRATFSALNTPPLFFTKLVTFRMPLPNLAKPFIAVPTFVTTVPSTTSSGPMAAARAATFRMVFFCASLMPFSLSTKACTLLTTARMAGISSSPKEIASSSNWDFRMVSWPFRLSCMVAAIFSETPLYSSTHSMPFSSASDMGMIAPSLVLTKVSEQESIAPESLSISSGAAFISARKPDMAFLPTRASAALAFSDSVICANAPRQSERISERSLMEPSALVV